MINDIMSNTEGKMQNALEALRKDLSSIRTGHATPSLIEHLKVEYAGVPTPLNHLAGISAPGAKLLVIQPWDKSSIHSIEKAIQKSDLGLTPVNDGNVIRLNIPPLTEERRQELTKVVRKRAEERKVVIRNLRREAMEEMKGSEKNKEISQDEHKRSHDELQKITDKTIGEIDKIGHAKEAELKEV